MNVLAEHMRDSRAAQQQQQQQRADVAVPCFLTFCGLQLHSSTVNIDESHWPPQTVSALINDR